MTTRSGSAWRSVEQQPDLLHEERSPAAISSRRPASPSMSSMIQTASRSAGRSVRTSPAHYASATTSRSAAAMSGWDVSPPTTVMKPAACGSARSATAWPT
ncbi:hypothetical protein [Amycolatopsis deserti]|uniref:hypothetical protein n=1 Tax=Amycolatopsis deserti TaxID=185696 RepID=UPI00174A1564|nr:hypothetical protein [Amycolatopsis deserti]